jgi:serine/threonine-protein kinase
LGRCWTPPTDRARWRSGCSRACAAPRISACVALLCSRSPPALAADANASSTALFQEGRALLEAGNYSRACPILERSLRQSPGTGTLLALAICHEGLGATATAWAEFRDVAEASKGEGRPDREQFARDRVRTLEPRLARITISVPSGDASAPNLLVMRDGHIVDPSAWGVDMPVDRGDHEVRATADGRVPWLATVHVEDGQRRAVTVEMAPQAPAAAARVEPNDDASPPVAEATARRRTAGWIVGGAGTVALGVGTFFGIRAITLSSDAKSRCSPSSCTDASAVAENDDAKIAAWVADVAVGAGAIAAVAGAYLILTSPAAQPASAARVVPLLGPKAAGVSLSGCW